MGPNKEDFRHFMLDSHESVSKVLLSKKSLRKCTVWVKKKTSLCLSAVHSIYCPESPWRRGHRQERRQPRVPVPPHPWQHQQLLSAKEKAASEIPFVDRPRAKAAFESLSASSRDGMGAEAAMLSNAPTLYPTPQLARWESSITWAGNGCIPRGVGQAFIWCEST